MTGQELVDGYEILFSPELRLAHEALLTLAAETEPDGWPTNAMIVRFARCYDVPLVELAALCGILVSRIGRRTVFSDARRHPELVNRISPIKWSRRALVCYGFYNVASALSARHQAMVH